MAGMPSRVAKKKFNASKLMMNGARSRAYNARVNSPAPRKRKETSMAKTRESTSPAAEKSRNGKYHPSQQEIAQRAYEIYTERHGAPGDEISDWIMAERELMEQKSKTSRKPAPRTKSAAA
jgi:hypothetical protein